MKILVDAMGGDNAPLEIIKGAVSATEQYHCSVVLIGDRNEIYSSAITSGIDISALDIVHADQKVKMSDPPLTVRALDRSSMRIGFDMLKRGDGDAFVSAGNTGALHCGSTLYVHRIKSIQRSAIATLLAFSNPFLLVDSGANITVTPEQLMQFAIMGSIYMKNLFDIKRPRVGILNIGTESGKGTPDLVEAYKLFSETETDVFAFAGNVEANSLPFNVCDVVVCSGFAGNIYLKTVEGMAKFMFGSIKDVFYSTPLTRLSALAIKKPLKETVKRFDASEYGGAPFLGISRPVIKAHGNSDAEAVKNAIRQACAYASSGIIYQIAQNYDSIAPHMN